MIDEYEYEYEEEEGRRRKKNCIVRQQPSVLSVTSYQITSIQENIQDKCLPMNIL